jgi:uncharacterized membrane protein
MDEETPIPFDHAAVMQAISLAEQLTSGEIRVVVYPRGVDDPVATAQQEFLRLGMNHTRERNAVLILVAPAAHAFAIFGDEGIHQRVGPGFWEEIATRMGTHFRHGRFTEGLVEAIRQTGELLARHFPRRGDDVNELPDDVIERGIVI